MGETVRVPTPLADRCRTQAEGLRRAKRSPLCIALLRGAAEDLDGEDGVVASLFGAGGLADGTAPQLRLLAALHRLVLDGGAPELAPFYPTAGGEEPPDGAWGAARAVLAERADAVRAHLDAPMQLNEPGRAAVLYGALLGLAERDGRPIRLLELGASAGLNLRPEAYAYRVGDRLLGDPASLLLFEDPWIRMPASDLDAAAARLEVCERAACDLAPLDAATDAGRTALLAHLWPDEGERLARHRAAWAVADAVRPCVDGAHAVPWLAAQLDRPRPGVLTVVWQSLLQPYMPFEDWRSLAELMAGAGPDVTWLRLEPGDGVVRGFELRSPDGDQTRVVARTAAHGPPAIFY